MTNHDQTQPGGRRRATGGGAPPGLQVSLEVIEGPDAGLRFEVRGSRVTLGRKDADLKLTDPTVSGHHATLEIASGKLFLRDNDSTNGTFVNGGRTESAPLSNLDEIGLGDTVLLLSVVEDRYGVFMSGPEDDEGVEDSRVDGSEATAIEEALPNPELDRRINVVLDITSGPDQGKKFQVSRRSTVIGRGERADFIIADPAVSQRHCQIEIHNKDKMTIKDLASSNGTRLNGHFISAVKIRHADIIQIGETSIKVLIHFRR